MMNDQSLLNSFRPLSDSKSLKRPLRTVVNACADSTFPSFRSYVKSLTLSQINSIEGVLGSIVLDKGFSFISQITFLVLWFERCNNATCIFFINELFRWPVLITNILCRCCCMKSLGGAGCDKISIPTNHSFCTAFFKQTKQINLHS